MGDISSIILKDYSIILMMPFSYVSGDARESTHKNSNMLIFTYRCVFETNTGQNLSASIDFLKDKSRKMLVAFPAWTHAEECYQCLINEQKSATNTFVIFLCKDKLAIGFCSFSLL